MSVTDQGGGDGPVGPSPRNDRHADAGAASADSAAAPPPGPGLDDWIKIYGVFRDYVKHGDSLINNRLSWLLSIHGFLYATYGLTIQKKLEIAQKIADTFKACGRDAAGRCAEFGAGSYFQNGNLGFAILQIEIFLLIIALTGCRIGYIGLRSIQAAKEASSNLRDVFHRQFEAFSVQMRKPRPASGKTPGPAGAATITLYRFGTGSHRLELPLITGGGTATLEEKGFFSSSRIPTTLILSWIVAIAFQIFYVLINFQFVSDIVTFCLGELSRLASSAPGGWPWFRGTPPLPVSP